MITLYKPPRRRSEGSDSSIERIIPAGTPYLTKVNGQLVMARDKGNKVVDVAVDLLGEAFGVNTKVIRKRAVSLDKPKGPLLIGGVPYVPQQQQLTYTAPLPQAAFSSQSLVPYPQTQPAHFVLPNPSQKDFDQLQQMQVHFNRMFGNGAPSLTSTDKEGVSKTTITITKHICAGCGRIRSKKYHQDHPLKEGETPAPDFCRRCQKDSSSTSSGGSSRPRKKKGEKTKHRKHHNKHAQHSSDDESSDSPAPKTHSKSKHHSTKKEPRRVPSEDYIIVEEEISEEEACQPRRRGRARERVVVEEYEVERQPLIPQNRQSSRPRRQSATRDRTFKIPRKPVRPLKVRETVLRETIRRRSPSIEYGYVDSDPRAEVIEERVETYPRKIPVQFYDDIVHEVVSPPREQYREYSAHERESSGKDYSVEEAESASRAPPSREYFEERGNTSLSRPQEARERRRRQRNSPTFPVAPPWEAPHVLHPRNNDDVIVVTERFEYRPKKQGHSEENRRRQEYVDRTTSNARFGANQFSAEEAARYFHEDWSRVDPEPVPRPIRRREHREHSYRRERHKDEDLSDSETSYEYRRTDRNNLLRAPTPPIYDSTKLENWQERPPYLLSSDSEATQRHGRGWKGKATQELSSTDLPRERGRSTSRTRPAYVREATDGGTEKALISSPRLSRERETEAYIGEISESDMTEKERIAEGEIRHVSFRDTPSVRSAQDSWIETSENWPVEGEQSGRGWNDDFERGGGSGWNQ